VLSTCEALGLIPSTQHQKSNQPNKKTTKEEKIRYFNGIKLTKYSKMKDFTLHTIDKIIRKQIIG
jgi:hypothetical protein